MAQELCDVVVATTEFNGRVADDALDADEQLAGEVAVPDEDRGAR